MVELMLAMGFLSALLVTISLLVIQITGIYQKGLSLRAVNSQGRQLIDEFMRAASGSSREDLGAYGSIDDAYESGLYFVSSMGNHDTNGDGVDESVQMNGVFCTGMYSYVWNTKYAFEDHPDRRLRVNGRAYKLVRVRDASNEACMRANDNSGDGYPNRETWLFEGADDNVIQPIELINSDESDLILYDFMMFPATWSRSSEQVLYSATFILATIRGGVNINGNGDYCQGTTLGLTTDFNYCAVNKFNFAMRSTGFSEASD